MTISNATWFVVPFGYLLGSIPFGLLLAKLSGSGDPRQQGSGNIGATNVSRIAGYWAGVLTLLLDAGKGAVAVWLASRFSGQNATAMMLAGIAALFGHCFPAWLAFRGGKGVATGLGMFSVLCPLAAAVALAVFVLTVVLWRYASLASLAGTAAMPLLIYLLWAPGHAPPLVITFGTWFATGLIFYKHRANLERLRRGTEPKFSSEKSRGDRA